MNQNNYDQDGGMLKRFGFKPNPRSPIQQALNNLIGKYEFRAILHLRDRIKLNEQKLINIAKLLDSESIEDIKAIKINNCTQFKYLAKALFEYSKNLSQKSDLTMEMIQKYNEILKHFKEYKKSTCKQYEELNTIHKFLDILTKIVEFTNEYDVNIHQLPIGKIDNQKNFLDSWQDRLSNLYQLKKSRDQPKEISKITDSTTDLKSVLTLQLKESLHNLEQIEEVSEEKQSPMFSNLGLLSAEEPHTDKKPEPNKRTIRRSGLHPGQTDKTLGQINYRGLRDLGPRRSSSILNSFQREENQLTQQVPLKESGDLPKVPVSPSGSTSTITSISTYVLSPRSPKDHESGRSSLATHNTSPPSTPIGKDKNIQGIGSPHLSALPNTSHQSIPDNNGKSGLSLAILGESPTTPTTSPPSTPSGKDKFHVYFHPIASDENIHGIVSPHHSALPNTSHRSIPDGNDKSGLSLAILGESPTTPTTSPPSTPSGKDKGRPNLHPIAVENVSSSYDTGYPSSSAGRDNHSLDTAAASHSSRSAHDNPLLSATTSSPSTSSGKGKNGKGKVNQFLVVEGDEGDEGKSSPPYSSTLIASTVSNKGKGRKGPGPAPPPGSKRPGGKVNQFHVVEADEDDESKSLTEASSVSDKGKGKKGPAPGGKGQKGPDPAPGGKGLKGPGLAPVGKGPKGPGPAPGGKGLGLPPPPGGPPPPGSNGEDTSVIGKDEITECLKKISGFIDKKTILFKKLKTHKEKSDFIDEIFRELKTPNDSFDMKCNITFFDKMLIIYQIINSDSEWYKFIDKLINNKTDDKEEQFNKDYYDIIIPDEHLDTMKSNTHYLLPTRLFIGKCKSLNSYSRITSEQTTRSRSSREDNRCDVRISNFNKIINIVRILLNRKPTSLEELKAQTNVDNESLVNHVWNFFQTFNDDEFKEMIKELLKKENNAIITELENEFIKLTDEQKTKFKLKFIKKHSQHEDCYNLDIDSKLSQSLAIAIPKCDDPSLIPDIYKDLFEETATIDDIKKVCLFQIYPDKFEKFKLFTSLIAYNSDYIFRQYKFPVGESLQEMSDGEVYSLREKYMNSILRFRDNSSVRTFVNVITVDDVEISKAIIDGTFKEETKEKKELVSKDYGDILHNLMETLLKYFQIFWNYRYMFDPLDSSEPQISSKSWDQISFLDVINISDNLSTIFQYKMKIFFYDRFQPNLDDKSIENLKNFISFFRGLLTLLKYILLDQSILTLKPMRKFPPLSRQNPPRNRVASSMKSPRDPSASSSFSRISPPIVTSEEISEEIQTYLTSLGITGLNDVSLNITDKKSKTPVPTSIDQNHSLLLLIYSLKLYNKTPINVLKHNIYERESKLTKYDTRIVQLPYIQNKRKELMDIFQRFPLKYNDKGEMTIPNSIPSRLTKDIKFQELLGNLKLSQSKDIQMMETINVDEYLHLFISGPPQLQVTLKYFKYKQKYLKYKYKYKYLLPN